MEVETMRRMILQWEDETKVATVLSDQDSKLAKVIRESRWKVEHEFDADHAKKSLDRIHERFPKEERQHHYGIGQRLKTGLIMCSTGRSPGSKGSRPGRMHITITVGTTADVPIPSTRVINRDSVITLKQKDSLAVPH
jgi:hypothetical protein